MTDAASSVFTPVTIVADEVIDTARSSLVTVSPILAAGAAAANPVRLAAILQDLAADAAQTLAARSHDEFCAAMKAWGEDLVELATVVLTPLGAAGVVASELLEALVIEALRFKFPRLASILSLAGVIVDDPGLGSRFDWEALRDFMLATPDLVDETFWDGIFGDADLDVTGRMPALLAALLIVAPETISALNAGDLRLAPLLPPPTAPDASPSWKQLRERSTGWVPITFPLQLDEENENRLKLADFEELRGGFQPELAISLLIRSQRRVVGGRTVTDFEMWLHPSTDAPFHELRTSSGFVTRLEPGVSVGAGYDGGTGTWNAAIAGTGNEATLRIDRDSPEGVPDLVFGPPYDTRLVIRDLGFEVRLREAGEPSVELVGRMDGLGLVVTNRWFRSLGEKGSKLREGLRFDVDLRARLTEGAGFSFSADGALDDADTPRGQAVQVRHGALAADQRADPCRRGSLRHPRRGAPALVGDDRSRHARDGRRRRMAGLVGRGARRREALRRAAAADRRRVPARVPGRQRRRLPRLHRRTDRPLRRRAQPHRRAA